MPSIEVMAFANNNGHDSTVTLQCLIGGFSPSQVDVYWLIGSKKENGQIGSFGGKNKENVQVNSVNHFAVSVEEWRTAGNCTCVVKSGSWMVMQTLHYYGKYTLQHLKENVLLPIKIGQCDMVINVILISGFFN